MTFRFQNIQLFTDEIGYLALHFSVVPAGPEEADSNLKGSGGSG